MEAAYNAAVFENPRLAQVDNIVLLERTSIALCELFPCTLQTHRTFEASLIKVHSIAVARRRRGKGSRGRCTGQTWALRWRGKFIGIIWGSSDMTWAWRRCGVR